MTKKREAVIGPSEGTGCGGGGGGALVSFTGFISLHQVEEVWFLGGGAARTSGPKRPAQPLLHPLLSSKKTKTK